MNPFVFVVGCPRSGTTLLQRMLDAHPDLTVTNDTHFIPRCRPDKGEVGGFGPDVVDAVLSYHRFHRLGIDAVTARRVAASETTYAGFVTRLYDQVAAQAGKRFAGEKTPDYVRHLPVLHELFPDAKVVHLVRDGRDVALSALEWARPGKGPGRFALWEEAPLAVCALWWTRFVLAGRLDGSALGETSYHEVRYENLVERPDVALASVADFLGISFDECMLRFHEGRERDDPSLSAKRAWRPPTTGLRSWRDSIEPRDVALFDHLAAPALDLFGYQRVATAGDDSLVAIAETYRTRWLDELAEREGIDGAAALIAGARS